MQAMVAQEMRKVYGSDSVAAVALSYDTASLDAAAAQFRALQEQFEDVLDWYQYKLPPQPADDVEHGSQQRQHRGGKAGGKIKRKMVSLHSLLCCPPTAAGGGQQGPDRECREGGGRHTWLCTCTCVFFIAAASATDTTSCKAAACADCFCMV